MPDMTDRETKLAAEDEELTLSQLKTLWQFGEWQRLVALDIETFRHKPERDRFALLVASAHQQLDNYDKTREYLRLALDWECPVKTVAQVLIAGVYNTLARVAFLKQDKAHIKSYFEASVAAIETNDLEQLSYVRMLRETAKFNFSPHQFIDQQPTKKNEIISSVTIREKNHPELRENTNENFLSKELPLSDLVDIGCFCGMFDKCLEYLNTNMLGDLDALKQKGIREIRKNRKITSERVLSDLIIQDGSLLGLGNGLRFLRPFDVPILIREILIDESYRFKSMNEYPLIIDCGANFGLSVYYFKSIFPKSKIIAFEPNPDLYSILLDNIKINDWDDVEVFPFALSNTNEKTKFFIPEKMPMGGSLKTRLVKNRNDIKICEVNCVRLNSYIEREVDFLKLDIEGSELEVLNDCEKNLSNVKFIFCEFHFGDGLSNDRLPQLLSVLSQAGFKYTVNGSLWNSSLSKYNDYFLAATSGKSLNIYATRN